MIHDIVTLEGIRFSWPNGSGDVLNIPELVVREKEKVFLQGSSGSGKTTLLSLLGGVITPQTGEVSIIDTRINLLKPVLRDSFRADHIGFVFQMFNLIPYLSLVDNVTLSCRFSAKRHKKATENHNLQEEARRLLHHLKLDPVKLGNRPVTELSVGQQQRVAVARALIGRPELIVADEPTSALDADARFSFLELLFEEIKLSGSSLIFVSHDLALKEKFDRLIAMSDINFASIREENN